MATLLTSSSTPFSSPAHSRHDVPASCMAGDAHTACNPNMCYACTAWNSLGHFFTTCGWLILCMLNVTRRRRDTHAFNFFHVPAKVVQVFLWYLQRPLLSCT
jgi:hypothetical protein